MYLEHGNTFLGCDVAQAVSPLSFPSENRSQSRASPLYLTVYLGQNFTPNTCTGHILWTKLGDETAARSCPKATVCSAVLSLGVLLPHSFILLGEKSSTMRWRQLAARFRGMRIIIEKPTR